MTGVTNAANRCLLEISSLEGVLSESGSLPPRYRKVVAELIIIRLAVSLENCLSASFYRLASGTVFESGRPAQLHTRAATIPAATILLHSGGRFSWLNGSELCSTLELAFRDTDPCLSNIRRHSTTLAEIRKIRNHVAHRNRISGRAFRTVVRRVYGRPLNSVSPGTLLLTPRNGSRSLCSALLIGARVLVREVLER